MEAFAVALVFITLFTSTAAVLVLRPLTKRLGEYLRHVHKERRGSRAEPLELEQIQALLERLNGRLELYEDRLDFTERLLASSPRAEPRVASDVNPVRRSS